MNEIVMLNLFQQLIVRFQVTRPYNKFLKTCRSILQC